MVCMKWVARFLVIPLSKTAGYGGAGVGLGLGHLLTRGLGGRHGATHIKTSYGGAGVGVVGLVGFAGLTRLGSLVCPIRARHVSLARPPHARLETHAPRATPKPMPIRGGGLGVSLLPTPKLSPHTPQSKIAKLVDLDFSVPCGLARWRLKWRSRL
ncbi:hypothetical protein Hanom_Chr03g00270151 [Helianthus anomalus]